MAVMTDMQRQRTGIFSKLPRLGTASRFLLLAGIFLIIFFVLFTFTNQEKALTEELQNTLSNLVIAAGPAAPAASAGEIESAISLEQQNYNNLLLKFPVPDNTVKIFDDIFKLADSYDLEVTSLSYGEGYTTLETGSDSLSYNVQNYYIGLSGEAAKMQSFIAGLSKFPTAVVNTLTIVPSGTESNLDIGNVDIQLYIREGDL